MKKTLMMTLLAAFTLAACQESLEERCEREASVYTEKKCPALIADHVTIDSLSFQRSTHTLFYYYTLGGVLDDAEALRQHDFKGMLQKELKNSTSMQLYKDAGYNFKYVYYSQKDQGRKLLEYTFRKKDYQ